MQLSEKTITQLKFLSKINQSFWFRKDTPTQTITDVVLENEDATIIAQFRSEQFPVSFGIYDLNQFLASIPSKDADFDFQKDCVIITAGKMKVRYMYCNPNMMVMGPDSIPTLEDVMAEFELDAVEVYPKFLTLAATNNLTTLVFKSDGSKLWVDASDPYDNGSNKISLMLSEEANAPEFSIAFDIENLKVMKDNYLVQLTPDMIKFISKADPMVQYLMSRKAD